MFLGYQNDLIAFIAETKEELENLPMVELTKIEETSEPVEMVDNKYCVGYFEIITEKQKKIRNIRNNYLVQYIDPVVSNPLRWNDMDSSEQQEYVKYRQYLLSYTKTENWWLQNPLTFDEWKQSEKH